MGVQGNHLTLLSNLNSNKGQSQKSAHLFPEGNFFFDPGSCLLFPLPGVDVPPRVQELVVKEEEDGGDGVAEEGGEDAKEEELNV